MYYWKHCKLKGKYFELTEHRIAVTSLLHYLNVCQHNNRTGTQTMWDFYILAAMPSKIPKISGYSLLRNPKTTGIVIINLS
jgi:hypothetical protein